MLFHLRSPTPNAPRRRPSAEDRRYCPTRAAPAESARISPSAIAHDRSSLKNARSVNSPPFTPSPHPPNIDCNRHPTSSEHKHISTDVRCHSHNHRIRASQYTLRYIAHLQGHSDLFLHHTRTTFCWKGTGSEAHALKL